MPQLDHRILIPKSSEVIWQYISDFANNPNWQIDCKTLSFLTSKRNNAGMRWRYTTASGREYVAETTAWYDGLGYEYTFVDGTPFRESKGRLRLQEIAEGTVVQWTFSYELGGLFGGLMNAVSARRQIENAMIDSLRLLWKEMQKVSAEQPFEAKSLMRDALDYEARAQYKPRHTSAKAASSETVTHDTPVTIPEPPITEEDTRPRQPVKLETDVHEPAFLSSLSETGEHAAVVVRPDPPLVAASMPALDEPPAAKPPIAPAPAVPEPTAEQERSEVPSASTLATDETDLVREVFEIAVPSEVLKEKDDRSLSFTTTKESTPPPDVEDSKRITSLDTAEVSVFDLFGIPRPSQTQEVQVVRVPELAPVVEAASTQRSRSALYRIGLRSQLRYRRVRLRRPV
jgi:hypothetical protein